MEHEESVKKLIDRLKRVEEDNARLKGEKDKMEEQINRLRRELENNAPKDSTKMPIGFVSSISAAAQNDGGKRDIYYTKILGQEPVRGGFVAHNAFVHFIKSARGDLPAFSTAKEAFFKDAVELVHSLASRDDTSFLTKSKPDHEAPQSLVASLLLSMASDHIRRADANIPRLYIAHQGEFKRDGCDPGTLAEDGKVDYKVDILCAVVSESKMKVVSTMEYKPDKRNPDARCAQRDMYATNTMSLHGRHCIGVDIAGGNKVEEWEITAMAYFANPRSNEKPLFELSSLYTGKGLSGLFAVALGLCAAATGWKDEEGISYRLGPVVARHGSIVLKGYDSPSYRAPNLAIMKELLGDEKASVWTSPDSDEKKGVRILQMKYIESEWQQAVSAKVFYHICDKLNWLHREKKKVHGDIRLANLLHNETDKMGYIIDADFVHKEYYPMGLKKLSIDGRRHEEVESAIENKEVHKLKKSEEHDLFSLAAVMKLFECLQDNCDSWNKAIKSVENGKIDGAIAILEKSEFSVKLSDSVGDHLIFETGPTPRKCFKPRSAPLESVEE